MERYIITVGGKVQGVFFRQSAKEVAEQLNLTGFARNDPDGSVYIEIEGDPTALKEFINWCRQGPPIARVKKVEHLKRPVVHYAGFDVI